MTDLSVADNCLSERRWTHPRSTHGYGAGQYWPRLGILGREVSSGQHRSLAGKAEESERSCQAHQGSETTVLQAMQRNILAAGRQPMLRRSVKCCIGMPHRSQVIKPGFFGSSTASVTGPKCQDYGHSAEQIWPHSELRRGIAPSVLVLTWSTAILGAVRSVPTIVRMPFAWPPTFPEFTREVSFEFEGEQNETARAARAAPLWPNGTDRQISLLAPIRTPSQSWVRRYPLRLRSPQWRLAVEIQERRRSGRPHDGSHLAWLDRWNRQYRKI